MVKRLPSRRHLRRPSHIPIPSPATVLVALLVGFGVVGAADQPAAQSTAMVAREAYVRGGFDPSRGAAPASCTALGLQFVASSADGAPWVHTCLDAFLRAPDAREFLWP